MKLTALVVAVLFSAGAFAQEINSNIKFKQGKIVIKKKIVDVELAETSKEQAHGLMFRTTLPEGKGMLFVFSTSEPRSFWMKNTFVPLSIAFFDKNKSILNFHDMAAAKSEMQSEFPSYESKGPAMYALEVPMGWFKKHKIKVGDHFEFSK